MRSLIENLQSIDEGLSQAKKLYLDTKKIPAPIFQRLAAMDPTPQKKYIEWICKIFLHNPEQGMLGKLSVLKDFEEMVQRNIIKDPAQRDIGRYKSLEQLVDVVMRNKEVKTVTQAKAEEKENVTREGTELVLDNEFCTVYRIMTEAASKAIGAGANWCTARVTGQCYFNEYHGVRMVQLYYIIPKGHLLKEIGKIAVSVNRGKQLKAADFASITDKPEELQKFLLNKGFIDDKGNSQATYTRLSTADGSKLLGPYASKTGEIYKILRNSFPRREVWNAKDEHPSKEEMGVIQKKLGIDFGLDQ